MIEILIMGREPLIEKTNILRSVMRTMWTTQHATRRGADGHTRTHMRTAADVEVSFCVTQDKFTFDISIS